MQDFYLESAPAVHVVRANVIPLDYNGLVRVNVVLQNASSSDVDARLLLRVFHADAGSTG